MLREIQERLIDLTEEEVQILGGENHVNKSIYKETKNT